MQKETITIHPYDAPAGGWGSVKSLGTTAAHFHAYDAVPVLRHQNKPDGYACVSCAWGRPQKSHVAEFCENGAKATFSELTSKRVSADFFARHTLAELRTWPDMDLEDLGRLTEPLRYDSDSDRYLPVSWEAAFADIGTELKALAPKSVVFYASGRASLETSYMYQLLARLYGNNNLPDSSNMCHETTSVALQKVIGQGVGTVHVADFEHTDCIFFFGQNVGSNSPRMLHQLQEARERGIPIVVFNPLRERGLIEFKNPQNPAQMLGGSATEIATHHHQVRPGGDIAALMGLCKAVLELDDQARADGKPRVLDQPFIEAHTHGFEAFEARVRDTAWADIEHESGLQRSALEGAARIYARATAVMAVYGMGLTQHKRGLDNVTTLVNFLLMRGNIGKSGAGICPVRGHSNVQGQRTVGISEKPELVPLDKLAKQFGFEPPRDKGLTTVETCEGVIDGSVRAFIGLGGNFVRAVPDHNRVEPAWSGLRLTVQIATKLNRSHLVHGQLAYLLPCLGRIERDEQHGVLQTLSTEDSTGWMHASRGHHAPASEQLLSEARIVAGIAKATLAPNPRIDWDAWCDDYGRVRDAIAETFPEIFHDFNRRIEAPGGFARPLPARERVWKTPSKKAEFTLPQGLSAAFTGDGGTDVMRLMTLRSNDQFNTTIYGMNDRFRGVEGTRRVVFMHREDIAMLGLEDGQEIGLSSAAGDGFQREVHGLRVVEYDLPRGSLGAYYPECNPLIPLWQHADESQVPAGKSVPVRVLPQPMARLPIAA
ncbi:FdhF/YdeP family oxidoreductase [Xylophilus rhododendri]|uniref:FdhF/YdeP family oxidoreductase n=1 Tax=Xylophilus rhododendri TaxID=2697032 RepID=A0A857JDC4_9BURK|nr:FdhF/YdeP family oxidoreductase [Xylophilus rhododendri]QHJ01110.1 FdhF/YdeP family oxidoreductase [Xylophilus rhododendri]